MTASQVSADLAPLLVDLGAPPVDLIPRRGAQRSLEGRRRAPIHPATPPWFEALLRKAPHYEGPKASASKKI